MTNIILIGAAHHDVQGEQSLERALQKEAPDVITVEMGPKTYKYLTSQKFLKPRTRMINLGKNMGLSQNDINLLNTLFYETRVVRKYAKSHDVSVHPIDPFKDSFIPKTYKRDLKNINPYHIKQLLHEISGMVVTEGEHKLYDIWFNSEGDHIPADEQEEINAVISDDPFFPESRDILPAENMHNLVTNMDDKQKLVHVGGSSHLCRDFFQRTLYELIKDLNPTRRTLKSY